MVQKLPIDIAPILATAIVKISSNQYDDISFQSPTWRNKSMELLITKSELPVFNCLKYTALMEHIDDRHISRETSSQISLARSKFSAMYIQQADLKISYFRTKIVSYNEPLDEIEPFICLSNHEIRYIHENSNILVFFHRLK